MTEDDFRRQMKWEPWKAMAGILVALVAVMGIILTVAHFLPQPAPLTIIYVQPQGSAQRPPENQ